MTLRPAGFDQGWINHKRISKERIFYSQSLSATEAQKTPEPGEIPRVTWALLLSQVLLSFPCRFSKMRNCTYHPPMD